MKILLTYLFALAISPIVGLILVFVFLPFGLWALATKKSERQNIANHAKSVWADRFKGWTGGVLLLWCAGASAAVNLGWDALPVTSNLSVRVYVAQSSRSTNAAYVAVPATATMTTVSNVLPGVSYFWATAIIASGPSAGLESLPSNEVTFTNRAFGPTNLTVILGTGGIASATMRMEIAPQLPGPWSTAATLTSSNLDLAEAKFVRGQLEIKR